MIRDFAGPYYVSADDMAFGRPLRYLQLDPKRVLGGVHEYDEAVAKASVVYGTRMHNLFCDNCHSHVGMALTLMKYNLCKNYNMVKLAAWVFFCSNYVSFWAIIRHWLPFAIVVTLCSVMGVYLK